MKNDQQDGDQGQGRLQTENLDATGELPASNNGNNNGHKTAEPRLLAKSKLTGGMRGSRRDQEHPRQEESFEKCPPARVLLQMAAGPAPGWKRKPGRI